MPEPASQPRRGRGRPGYDQATVLRRAIDLFNRKGYDGTSMADLAEELGLTKSALYHHVPSKTYLLAQALDVALGELTVVIEQARQDAATPACRRLRAVVRRSVEVLIAHQPAVTLLLRVRGNSELELAALRRRRWIDAQLAALVQQAVAEGSLRGDLPPDLVSRLLFGMVNSLTEWYRPEGEVSAAAVSDALTTIVFDGLDARPGREDQP